MCAFAGWNCVYDERGGVMDSFRQYVLSLIASALICSIFKKILGVTGKPGSLTNVVCGLFMVITALSPVVNFDIPDFDSFTYPIFADAKKVSEAAAETAKADMCEIIKEEARTYVLEKAKSCNVDIDVEVSLDDEKLVPDRITVTGSVSPYDKTVLQDYICTTLDIPKERQIWTE